MPETASDRIAPHFCPIIHTFETDDLIPILRRSAIHSLSQLFAPFQSGVQKVAVRSSTYQPSTLSQFNVRFIQRKLPESFGHQMDAGTDMHHQRRRNSTVSISAHPGHSFPLPSSTPIDPSSPQTIYPSSVLSPMPASTAFPPPTSGQRDELFLDSLSSLIAQRVDSWLTDGRQELSVVLESSRQKTGSETAHKSETVIDEGWRGATIESLTPWYTTMRDEVLKRREMVEYDTFGWPVAST